MKKKKQRQACLILLKVNKLNKVHDKWMNELKAAKKSIWMKKKEEKAEEEEEEKGEEEEEEMKINEQELEMELKRIESEASVLRGNVNMSAIEEYDEREKEYLKCVADLDQGKKRTKQTNKQTNSN